jgi:hypothetical protein
MWAYIIVDVRLYMVDVGLYIVDVGLYIADVGLYIADVRLHTACEHLRPLVREGVVPDGPCHSMPSVPCAA